MQAVLNDLEYYEDEEEEDNESFKSAVAIPPTTAVAESFVGYSYTVCVNPLSIDFDSSSHDSDFEDAHDEFSEEEEEEEEEDAEDKTFVSLTRLFPSVQRRT
jgi:hypothetical protein